MAAKRQRGGFGLPTNAVLEQLPGKVSAAELSSDIKTAAYKTVAVFSDIIGRKLVLRHADIDLGCLLTDGVRINVDMTAQGFYRDVEHGLAHIVFGTDFEIFSLFVREYVQRVAEAVKKFSKVGFFVNCNFQYGLEKLVSIIEAHRVECLWGNIYFGSYRAMRARHRSQLLGFQPAVHDSLILYLMSISCGLEVCSGRLDFVKPYCAAALKMVEGRDFLATLLVSKWLLTCLIDEWIRQSSIDGFDSKKFKPKNKDLSCWEGGGYGAFEGTSEPEESDLGSLDTSRLRVEGLFTEAPEKRVEALRGLCNLLELPSKLDHLAGSVENLGFSSLRSSKSASTAKHVVSRVFQFDLKDDAGFRHWLKESEGAAQSLVETLQKELFSTQASVLCGDEWSKKGCMARVEFLDVTRDDILNWDVSRSKQLLFDDRRAVNRLRTLFQRVLGKSRLELHDTGSEVDVESCITRYITKEAIPCFKHEVMGKGFRALILLDRSASMEGIRTEQAERACRIIKKALDFSFVTLNVWGFQSLDLGEVTISRFAQNVDRFDARSAALGGNTPLHVAIKLASRYLQVHSEAKHLFVITDGVPVYQLSGGQFVSRSQLMQWVRRAVQIARTNGVNVTTVLIDSFSDKTTRSATERDLSFMFGKKVYWNVVEPARLGDSLINLVRTSFLRYLQSR